MQRHLLEQPSPIRQVRFESVGLSFDRIPTEIQPMEAQKEPGVESPKHTVASDMSAIREHQRNNFPEHRQESAQKEPSKQPDSSISGVKYADQKRLATNEQLIVINNYSVGGPKLCFSFGYTDIVFL